MDHVIMSERGWDDLCPNKVKNQFIKLVIEPMVILQLKDIRCSRGNAKRENWLSLLGCIVIGWPFEKFKLDFDLKRGDYCQFNKNT